MAERLSTGVAALDREIGGGLSPGHVVVLETPPGSQGEALLKELADAHDTLYLSTTRTATAVSDWLGIESGWTWDDGSAIEIQRVDLDTPVRDVDQLVKAVGEQVYLVIDPVNPLEVSALSKYLALLRGIRNQLQNTGSVAVLHAALAEATPENRWLTLQMADVVWRISTDDVGSDGAFQLLVTKSRNAAVPDEGLKLELGEAVTVDTSRDIA